MPTVVARQLVDRAGVERWLSPRRDMVVERPLGGGRFDADAGPFLDYQRTVTVEQQEDGRAEVTSTTEYRLAIPYFGWLFALPVRRLLRTPPRDADRRQPWWAPPDRLDPRSASMLGTLAAASVVAGYLGTLITQTITFAADSFGHDDDSAQGYTLAAVRVGIVLALVLVAVADRRGRRRVLLVSAAAGCVVAATGAAAPSLIWLGASQTVARAFSLTLAVIIGIFVAEEMPPGARAYGASVTALSAALGAGFCVMALPLADVADDGWRLLYLLPLLGLPLVRGLATRLPESKRFRADHAVVPLRGHGRRLALLAATAFLLTAFSTPASQFQNEFLRDERGFAAARISLFTILTSTPAAIGVVVGGRLADVRGRRRVASVGIAGGTLGTVLMFQTAGWGMWAWSLGGTVLAALTVPALDVYGPELFPTSLRGRANGIIRFFAVAGSSAGLLAAGLLSDTLGGLGAALAVLAAGPVAVIVLILVLFPETAHRELEELNPEDELPPARPSSESGQPLGDG